MLRKYLILLLLVSGILSQPTQSSAQNTERVTRHANRITLHFQDSKLNGRQNNPTLIFLKKELRARYPNIDISSLNLHKVTVMAKSRKGHATAQLRVGSDLSRKNYISGSPRTFHDPGKYTFERISFTNPSHVSNGPWQLLLTGKIVLRKVILFVDRDTYSSSPGYGVPPHRYDNNRDDRYENRKRKPYQQVPLPLVLPGRAWGTDIEGERLCGQRSRNTRDGWDYPGTVCDFNSRATFHGEYKPVRLYIRPDIRSLEQFQLHENVGGLSLTATLAGGNNQKKPGPVSATFGIDIAGRTFTKKVFLNAKASPRGKSRNETHKISGNWTRRDLQQARIWILPNGNTGDFTVQQFQLRITGMR